MDELLDPKQKPFLRWLLKRAFNMRNMNEPRGPRHECALHAAARDGNLPQVKWLLARGAVADVRDKDGNR
jgi:ankyrin repeat protein